MTIKLDIPFEWTLDDKGYEIVERKTEQPKSGARVGQPEGIYIARLGGELRLQQPLQFQESLFLYFANLNGSPKQCVEFANRFGYLWPEIPSHPGESLILWQSEIKKMHSAVKTWRDNPRDLFEGGRIEIRVASLEAVLMPTPPDGRPAVRYRPRSLLGAMWLEFAQTLGENINVGECQFCGEWFGIQRSGARFCGDKCRISFHNDKKRRAG